MKNCLTCNKPVPKVRKRTALYCCHDCYYEAKKQRSINRYNVATKNFADVKKNEKILHELYVLMQLKKTLSFHDLERLGFNWGISDREIAGSNSTIWKVVGGYAYYIDPQTKNVTIWKM
jgi:hypothetical protein